MNNKINRAYIYYASLENENVVGSEQRGIRPVVVVQNDMGNEFSSTVIIVPITTKMEEKAKLPTHIPLKNYRYRVIKNSMILAEQIRVIDKSRLKECVGRLDSEETKMLEKAICIALGIDIQKLNTKKDLREVMTRNQIASYGVIAKEYLRHCGNLEITNEEFSNYIVTLMDLYSPEEAEQRANKKR